MEIKIDWNKERSKWNVHTQAFGNIPCVEIITSISPYFKRWVEGGQYRGAVFFEGSVRFEKGEKGKIAYIDAILPD